VRIPAASAEFPPQDTPVHVGVMQVVRKKVPGFTPKKTGRVADLQELSASAGF